MYSENSKTSDPHRLLLNLSDKMNLKRSDKYVALSNLKISTPTLNKVFELLDGSYSVLDIRDYFELSSKYKEKRLIILQ